MGASDAIIHVGATRGPIKAQNFPASVRSFSDQNQPFIHFYSPSQTVATTDAFYSAASIYCLDILVGLPPLSFSYVIHTTRSCLGTWYTMPSSPLLAKWKKKHRRTGSTLDNPTLRFYHGWSSTKPRLTSLPILFLGGISFLGIR